MYFFGPLENLCCEKIINLPSRSRQGSELYRDVVCQVKHSDIQINHILLSSLSLLTAEVWSVCWGLQGGHWNCSNDVIFIIHLKYKILTFVKVFCKSGGKEIISQSRSNSIDYQTQHTQYTHSKCVQSFIINCQVILAVPVDTMQMYRRMVGLLFEAQILMDDDIHFKAYFILKLNWNLTKTGLCFCFIKCSWIEIASGDFPS